MGEPDKLSTMMTFEGISSGVYEGVIVSDVNDASAVELKVRIPQLDGVDSDILSLPAAHPLFYFAGNGFGMFFPYHINDRVIVSVLDDGRRYILGTLYAVGDMPERLSDNSDDRNGKTVGIQTPGGSSFIITYNEFDSEVCLKSASGYRLTFRDDVQLPNENNETHSKTIKRGIKIETPNDNYIEFDEESDDTENHSLNIKVTGTRNDEATEAINIILDPGEKLASVAPARKITVAATSEDEYDVRLAKVVVDTKGNADVIASGNINLSKVKNFNSQTIGADSVGVPPVTPITGTLLFPYVAPSTVSITATFEVVVGQVITETIQDDGVGGFTAGTYFNPLGTSIINYQSGAFSIDHLIPNPVIAGSLTVVVTYFNTVANMEMSIDVITSKSKIELTADDITLTSETVTLDAPIGVVQNDLIVSNAGVPIVVNEHTHIVTVLPNTPPPAAHTHTDTVSSPTP